MRSETVEPQAGSAARLRRAVRDSSTNLAIPPKMKPSVFETAHAFARKLPSLSDRQLDLINKMLWGHEELRGELIRELLARIA